jgi:hypothetical protein
MENMIRCPRCKGSGSDPILGDWPMGSAICSLCCGDKKIADDHITPQEIEQYNKWWTQFKK